MFLTYNCLHVKIYEEWSLCPLYLYIYIINLCVLPLQFQLKEFLKMQVSMTISIYLLTSRDPHDVFHSV